MKIHNSGSKEQPRELIGPNELKERLDDHKAKQKTAWYKLKKFFTKSK